VHPGNASRFRHWIRLHGFDGWQVFGSACLVIGVLGFSALVVNLRQPLLPGTHGAFLLQTVLGGGPQPSQSAGSEPSPAPSASPAAAAPIPATAPQPSPSRSGTQPVKPSAPGSPTATPTPSATPTPAPIDNPPTAILTASSAGGRPPSATADASSSWDKDATSIVSYQFNWGDGQSSDPQASPSATHVYAAYGSYSVTVTVVDRAGLSSTATVTVIVRL
jgi:PKD domain